MDYEAMTRSSRTWGGAFYFVWSLLMLLVLANVFIAILTEAYSEVQMDLTGSDDLNFIGKGWTKMKDKINKLKVNDMDEDGDGMIGPEELAKQTGITVERAREVISRD